VVWLIMENSSFALNDLIYTPNHARLSDAERHSQKQLRPLLRIEQVPVIAALKEVRSAQTRGESRKPSNEDWQILRRFDKDADGKLRKEEMKSFLKSLETPDQVINGVLDSMEREGSDINVFSGVRGDLRAAASVGLSKLVAPVDSSGNSSRFVLNNAQEGIYHAPSDDRSALVSEEGRMGCNVKWSSDADENVELCLTYEALRDRYKVFFDDCTNRYTQQWALDEDGCLGLIGDEMCIEADTSEAWISLRSKRTKVGNFAPRPNFHMRERRGAMP